MKNIGQKSGNGPIGDQFVATGGPSGGAYVGSGKDGGWTGLGAWESIDYWKMEILARIGQIFWKIASISQNR